MASSKLNYFVSLFLVLGCVAVVMPGAVGTACAATAHKRATSKTHKVAAKSVGRKSAGRKSAVRAGTSSRATRKTSTRTAKTVVVSTGRRHRHGARMRLVVGRVPSRSRAARYGERFTGNSFADINDLTQGDVTEGEDPVVRAAAIEALGNMNGTALAIDPSSGRILAMVNQKLALSPGAEPCSTIKLSVALAALEEGIVTRDTPVNLGGNYHMTLTEALAHSNNLYFETLGRSLGFERVKHYANEFGLGELAGYHIQGEQLGAYPDHELPAAQGGVGRMCSFGESVSMTPLQLGAMVAAIANGGTLYYLQHPQTPDEIASFVPKVKRILDIAPLLPDMHEGMAAAVQYGTARSLKANFTEFPVMGKTGTCSNNGVRYGWFGSFADTPTGRIVTVIFLEGGRPTFGPKAAELTGEFYKGLWDREYFQPKTQSAETTISGTR
jgi:penicillin-binding protein 2